MALVFPAFSRRGDFHPLGSAPSSRLCFASMRGAGSFDTCNARKTGSVASGRDPTEGGNGSGGGAGGGGGGVSGSRGKVTGSASMDLGHVSSTADRDATPADGQSDGVGGALSGGSAGSAGSGGGGGTGYPYDELGQPPQARFSPTGGHDAAAGGAPIDSVRK